MPCDTKTIINICLYCDKLYECQLLLKDETYKCPIILGKEKLNEDKEDKK